MRQMMEHANSRFALKDQQRLDRPEHFQVNADQSL
jgi:hypothetical protein